MGAFMAKTPVERFLELSDRTPVWDEVELLYDSGKERLRHQDYRLDLKLNKVKRCP
jgi:hypothetical protein